MFRIQGFYLLWPAFQSVLLHQHFVTLWQFWCTTYRVPQHRNSNATRLDTVSVWALPVSLAATQGVVVTFLSSGY